MTHLVGISCCNKSFGPNGLPNHAASDFCVRAVCELSGAVPVLLPAIGDSADHVTLLERLDGILLTGSRTNIEPSRYGGGACAADSPQDRGRDATTLPLIRAALAKGTPILAICRGMQELNVALGGTLYQDLSEVAGRIDHAAALPEDPVGRVTPAHEVSLRPGGILNRLARAATIAVNSLHNQGIDRLASGLDIEAWAADGTIEAVCARSAGFVLGVQWHPEFSAGSDAVSAAIFRAFGVAVRTRFSGERMAAD